MAVSSSTVRLDLSELEDLSEAWADAVAWIQGETSEAERVALKAAQILTGETRAAVYDTVRGAGAAHKRTGALARSYREEVNISAANFTFGTYSNLVYARVQDKGGRIYPKGRALAIPMTTAARLRWPRDWARGELFRPRGKDYLASSNGTRLEVQYLLRPSVFLHAKDYTGLAKEKAMPQVAKVFTRALAQKMGAS